MESAEYEDYAAETRQNLENLSDENLAKLNPQARSILIKQLTAIAKEIPNNPSMGSDEIADLQKQFENQITRLQKTGGEAFLAT